MKNIINHIASVNAELGNVLDAQYTQLITTRSLLEVSEAIQLESQLVIEINEWLRSNPRYIIVGICDGDKNYLSVVDEDIVFTKNNDDAFVVIHPISEYLQAMESSERPNWTYLFEPLSV